MTHRKGVTTPFMTTLMGRLSKLEMSHDNHIVSWEKARIALGPSSTCVTHNIQYIARNPCNLNWCK